MSPAPAVPVQCTKIYIRLKVIEISIMVYTANNVRLG